MAIARMACADRTYSAECEYSTDMDERTEYERYDRYGEGGGEEIGEGLGRGESKGERVVEGEGGRRKNVVTISPFFLNNALYDLLQLCCSRISVTVKKNTVEKESGMIMIDSDNNCEDHNSSKRRKTSDQNSIQNKNNKNNESSKNSKKKKNFPSPNFNVLLIELLEFIAVNRGYENSSLLLLDHSRRILGRWILENIGSDNDGDDNNNDNNNSSVDHSNNNSENESDSPHNNLTLREFPWKILSPSSGSFAGFLKDFQSIIIPILCGIESTRKRWKHLKGEYWNYFCYLLSSFRFV